MDIAPTTIVSVAFGLSWLFTVIESIAVQYFNPFFFKTGLVVLRHSLYFPDKHMLITNPLTIEKDTGKFRFTTGGKIYFRPLVKWFEFQVRTPFPYKCIGRIVDGNQVDVVARIPLGGALFFVCAILFVAFIGMAAMPAGILAAVFAFFSLMAGICYWIESRRMKKMLMELEQIAWELSSNKSSVL